MPADQTIARVFMRVDTHDENLIQSFIKNEKMVVAYVVFHLGKTGENKHFHLAGSMSPVSLQTFRNHIKSHFKVKKDEFSAKEWGSSEDDINDVYSYPYHEENVKFLINNLTEPEQLAAQARNQIIREKTKVIEKKKKDGKTQWEIIEDIRKDLDGIYEEMVTNNPEEHYRSRATYDKIMNVILKHLDLNKIRTGMFDIERWFVTVVRNKPTFKEQIKEKIYSKLYT